MTELFPLTFYHQKPLSGIDSPYYMVVLHGLGDSLNGFSFLQECLGIQNLNYLLFNAPDTYYTGFSWYDIYENPLPGIQRSKKLLEETFDKLTTDLKVDLQKTFLLGFSQGALMTFEFGTRYGENLAGYIPISGYTQDPNLILKEANKKVIHSTDWFVSHGTQDDVIPIEKVRKQMTLLKNSGFKLNYKEYQKGHSIEPVEEIKDIKHFISSRIQK